MADRVLMLIESCAPSGLVTQARLVAERLEEQGFEPHFCTLTERGAMAAELLRVAPLTSAGRRHAADPFAVWKIRRQVQTLRPAVVHAWGATAANYAAAALTGRHHPRFVATLGRAPTNRSAWRRGADAQMRRRAAAIVAPSEAVAEGLGGAGVKVITPGVASTATTAEPTAAEKAALRAELALPNDARVIAMVARLLPRKAVKEMIWVADLLRVVRDETRLLVIGDGPERPSLERFVRLASTPEHVRVLGERSDATRLLRGAEVAWHAGDEASPPLAVLEAMAAGVPVVADATDGCRQTITDGENGRLVTPRNRTARVRATQRLFDDDNLRRSLSSAARHSLASFFSADRMTADYAEIYRRVG